jgi:hypothetical protein
MHVQIIRTSRESCYANWTRLRVLLESDGEDVLTVVALHVQVVHDVEQVATFEVEDGGLERDDESALA